MNICVIQINAMKTSNKLQVYNCLYFIYRRLFRKALVTAVSFCIINYTLAQPLLLHGSWTGKIFMTNETVPAAVELLFNNNVLVNLSDEINKKSWYSKASMQVKEDANAVTLTWTENSEFGVHSEIYKIAMISADSATLYWKRHSVIFSNDKTIRDEAFNISGKGFIVKTPVIKPSEFTRH
jgi:hypothetical protein